MGVIDVVGGLVGASGVVVGVSVACDLIGVGPLDSLLFGC
jgi:hypothetical protein